MGNYYCPKFQLLDGSTYNNSGSNSKCKNVTFKSLFMATRIFRYTVDVHFENGESRSAVYYNSAIGNEDSMSPTSVYCSDDNWIRK